MKVFYLLSAWNVNLKFIAKFIFGFIGTKGKADVLIWRHTCSKEKVIKTCSIFLCWYLWINSSHSRPWHEARPTTMPSSLMYRTLCGTSLAKQLMKLSIYVIFLQKLNVSPYATILGAHLKLPMHIWVRKSIYLRETMALTAHIPPVFVKQPMKSWLIGTRQGFKYMHYIHVEYTVIFLLVIFYHQPRRILDIPALCRIYAMSYSEWPIRYDGMILGIQFDDW